MAKVQPWEIKTRYPVFFIIHPKTKEAIPLHKFDMVQDEVGNFFAKSQYSSPYAFPISASFADNTPPRGYKKQKDGSHRYSILKAPGYVFDPNHPERKPALSELQMAIDIRIPWVGAEMICNMDIKSINTRRDLKSGSFIHFSVGSHWQFYDVHSLGYPKSGQTVKAGRGISSVYDMAGFHKHLYSLYNGKQYKSISNLIVVAGKEWDKKWEAANKPPVDPCEERVRTLNDGYIKVLSEKESVISQLTAENDKVTREMKITKDSLSTAERANDELKKRYETFISDLEGKQELALTKKDETITGLEKDNSDLLKVNLNLRKKRGMLNIGNVFTEKQVIKYFNELNVKGIKAAISSLFKSIKSLFERFGGIN